MLLPPVSQSKTSSAFSLVEILMAIGVITLLMAFGVSAFPQGSQGRVLKETAKLAVYCELAAQNAKASNRWVYLFLHEDTETDQVHLVMVSDRDGADAFATATTIGTTDQTLEVLGRTERLSGVGLEQLGDGLYTGRTLKHEGLDFEKSLRFSPTGQVDSHPGSVTSTQIGVKWVHDQDTTPPVVLELAYLTGMTQILQP